MEIRNYKDLRRRIRNPGDYVLIAKDNQPTLRADIELLHMESFPPSGGNVRQGARPDRGPQDLDQ